MWRLKVINGCAQNDDLTLPLAPQPSLLQSFYARWSDEDENRYRTSRPIETEPHPTRYKRKRKATRQKKTYSITLEDWLHSIPHVVLGRHTCLPSSCRLRHPCVSRLHSRVAYIADAATHKLVRTIYPSIRRQLAEVHPAEAHTTRKSRSQNKHGNGDKHTMVYDVDCGESDSEESSSLFEEPYYRIIHCGSNPLYVNDELLPCGHSRRLQERDIVSFLENPFEEEGGVLDPLRPGDAAGRGESHSAVLPKSHVMRGVGNPRQPSPMIVDASEENHWPAARGTARVLFDTPHGSSSNPIPSRPFSVLRGEEWEMGEFVEVNGVRIARRRGIGARSHTCEGFPMEWTPPRMSSVTVEHNRLITPIREGFGEGTNIMAGVVSPHLEWRSPTCKQTTAPKHTPPPPPSHAAFAQTVALNNNTNNNNKDDNDNKDDDKHQPQEGSGNAINHDTDAGGAHYVMDVVEEVVSPLQQRFLPSPHTSRFAANAISPALTHRAGPHTSVEVVPARLPVYVFARRSPSPQGFTRQASSISRLDVVARKRLSTDKEKEKDNPLAKGTSNGKRAKTAHDMKVKHDANSEKNEAHDNPLGGSGGLCQDEPNVKETNKQTDECHNGREEEKNESNNGKPPEEVKPTALEEEKISPRRVDTTRKSAPKRQTAIKKSNLTKKRQTPKATSKVQIKKGASPTRKKRSRGRSLSSSSSDNSPTIAEIARQRAAEQKGKKSAKQKKLGTHKKGHSS